MQVVNWKTLSEVERKQLLSRPTSNNNTVNAQVAKIIAQVKAEGDQAVRQLTMQFDNVDQAQFKVTAAEFADAKQQVSADVMADIQKVIARIQRYQQDLLPQAITINTNDGVICQLIPKAIQAVGLYVPGGTAPLISTLMMLVIPAQIAGCAQRIVCTPPSADGTINPYLLTTAQLCGIETIYKIGGAQAIAAMAYGTQTVPKVSKIFGPGNAWVNAAKMQVALDPAGAQIDLPAGPSEVLIIADLSANAEFIAADLLSQAEHGVDSQVILITNSKSMMTEVSNCLQRQLAKLSRKTIAAQALQHSVGIIVDDLKIAFALSDQYAPEHLILQCENPDDYVPLINNAGAVFVGPWTPESLGDYVTGANHVLPTSGYARCVSGLSVADFMRYLSVQQANLQGLQTVGPIAQRLATIEGLDAHSNAITVRQAYMENSNE